MDFALYQMVDEVLYKSLQVLSTIVLHSNKCTRALTFENFCIDDVRIAKRHQLLRSGLCCGCWQHQAVVCVVCGVCVVCVCVYVYVCVCECARARRVCLCARACARVCSCVHVRACEVLVTLCSFMRRPPYPVFVHTCVCMCVCTV